MEEKKYFMWYDSEGEHDYQRGGPCYGPHYAVDEELIGKKLFHSLEDLLKTKATFSESIKKRLINSKVGTKIKVHYLHRSGNLMLRRVSEEELKIISRLEEIYNKERELNSEINKLELESEVIRKKLGFQTHED